MSRKQIISLILCAFILANSTVIVNAKSLDDGWSDGTENIALNRPVYGYNLLPAYNNTKNINDGNYNTQATIGPIADGFVIIFLDREYYISKVRIRAQRLWTSAWEHNKEELDVILQFKREKSNQWEEIQRIKDFPNAEVFELEIKTYGNKAKEVRLYKNGFSSGLDINQLVIFEIEIYEAIDTKPPTTYITYGPEEGSFVKNSFELGWIAEDNADENEITHQYRLLPLYPQWSEWSYKKSYRLDNLNYEGQLTFQVRSKDLAGNVGDTASRSFYVDKTPPYISIELPKKGMLYIGNREIIPIKRNYAIVVGNGDMVVNSIDCISGISNVEMITPFGKMKPSVIKDSTYIFKNYLYNVKYSYIVIASDKADNNAEQQIEILTYFSNSPPIAIDITAPSTGKEMEEIICYAKVIDVEGDDIYYYFSWGDGTDSGWLGPLSTSPLVNTSIKASHTYKKGGSYCINFKVRDSNGEMEDYLINHNITISNKGRLREDKSAICRIIRLISKLELNRIIHGMKTYI